MITLKRLQARQILDSRGYPTLEVEAISAQGHFGRASIPAGASKGRHEACELRDGDMKCYDGRGVLQAIAHIEETVQPVLRGRDICNQADVDACLCALDGTPQKSRLGANTLLGVSLSIAHAAAQAQAQPLYRYLATTALKWLPMPCFNVINGGQHANNALDVQEYMVVPIGATTFAEALHWGANVYHTLATLLHAQGYSTAVGDEGGFAPPLHGHEMALELLLRAIEQAGYRPGRDVALAIDAASTTWYKASQKGYVLPSSQQVFTPVELSQWWIKQLTRYPIVALEDPLAEDDWAGWQYLTAQAGQRVRLIGDDLFVTHAARLRQGIAYKAGNAILIKMNQVGTLTETLDTVKKAQEAGWVIMLSHRSGETEDTSVADLAVALQAPLIKAGAPARAERTAKYNQLLRIAAALGPDIQLAQPFTACG